VAFMEPQVNVYFYINRALDAFFITDLVLQFFIKTRDSQDRIVKEPRKIARAYLLSWFSIDLVSVFPFDLVAILVNSGEAANLKGLRVIRVLRLIKLARIFRLSRILVRWQNAYAVNYSMAGLYSYLVVVLTATHWLSCSYQLIKALEESEVNWVSEDSVNADKTISTTYLAGFYWAVQTISSIGYGDVGPRTTSERVYVTIGMMVSSVIFAFALGAICGAVTAMCKKDDYYKELMNTANEFGKEVDLPLETSIQIRAFFKHRHKTNTLMGSTSKTMFDELSPQLCEEVALHSHSDWVHSVPFFQGCPDRFVINLAVYMELLSCGPKEAIYEPGDVADSLYIVNRGLLASGGTIFNKGKVVGVDVLHSLVYTPVKRTKAAKTLTYADCHHLKLATLQQVLKRFPSVAPRIRLVAIKSILIEHVFAFTRACQTYAAKNTGQSKNLIVHEMEAALLKRSKQIKTGGGPKYAGKVRQCYEDELLKMKDSLRTIGATVTALEELHEEQEDS